jgi:hypothetical protein
MTPEERQLLTELFDRVRSASGNHRDPEAEAFIAEQIRAQPYAPYLMAQAALKNWSAAWPTSNKPRLNRAGFWGPCLGVAAALCLPLDQFVRPRHPVRRVRGVQVPCPPCPNKM